MKYLLSGGFGYGNVGDEAQLAGIVDEIKSIDNNSHITVLSPNPNYTRNEHVVDDVILATRECVFLQTKFPQLYNVRNKRDGIVKGAANFLLKVIFSFFTSAFILNAYFFNLIGASLPIKGWRKIINKLNESDCLFIVGGGYLTEDTYSRLIDTTMLMITAKVFGKKVIVSGQTVGHIKGRLNRWFFRKALNNADLFSTRDPLDSIRSLESLGCKEGKVFSFTSDDALFVKNKKKYSNKFNSYVGLQLHFWGVEDKNIVLDYYEHLIVKMRSIGLNNIVVFGMHSSDEEAISDLLTRSGLRDIKRLEYDYDYDEIISFISQLHLCVTMKHHPIIFSMGAAVPVVSINNGEYYIHKNKGAMLNFSMDAYMADINQSPEIAFEHIKNIQDNYTEISDIISEGLLEAKNRRNAFYKIAKEEVLI